MSEALVLGLMDVALAFALLECVVLLIWNRRTGAGLPPRDLLPNLAAGLLLMLALQAAVRGADAAWIVLALALAGAAHGVDIRRRWRRRPPSGVPSRPTPP